MNEIIPSELIISKIYIIRGKKVMLDRDLAALYGVKTMVLNQAVRRNIRRFPEDFMFQLTDEENESLKSQIVILETGRGKYSKFRPLVFAEQGVTMLACILNSERSIAVNIQIIRTFTRLREMIADSTTLRNKIEEMEQRYDEQFRVVFEAMRQMLDDEGESPGLIGFVTNTDGQN